MQIRVGFEMEFSFPQPVAMVLSLRVHSTREHDLLGPENLEVHPFVPLSQYVDSFGNRCDRLFVEGNRLSIRNEATVNDSGLLDPQSFTARQHHVQDLPPKVLIYLLASRYCEVDSELNELAGNLFNATPPGWARVQAICDFVHGHLQFDYMQARANRTALEAYREGVGVCRDYTHLAITLCRCMNLPSRYCTGYLSDIGGEPANPMDFAAWFEVYLDGDWHVFDARNNVPHIGRILMARGRDAADAALTTTYGVSQLESFQVWTYETT